MGDSEYPWYSYLQKIPKGKRMMFTLMFQCFLCRTKTIFLGESEIYAHIKETHNISEEKETNSYPCSLCPHVYQDIKELKLHFLRHYTSLKHYTSPDQSDTFIIEQSISAGGLQQAMSENAGKNIQESQSGTSQDGGIIPGTTLVPGEIDEVPPSHVAKEPHKEASKSNIESPTKDVEKSMDKHQGKRARLTSCQKEEDEEADSVIDLTESDQTESMQSSEDIKEAPTMKPPVRLSPATLYNGEIGYYQCHFKACAAK